MDARRFDSVVRQLAAAGGSRRGLVRGLAGGVLAAATATLRSRSAAADASHPCCIYQCGNTFTTTCSRGNPACTLTPPGCDSAGGYLVRRCSDCAAIPPPIQ